MARETEHDARVVSMFMTRAWWRRLGDDPTIREAALATRHLQAVDSGSISEEERAARLRHPTALLRHRATTPHLELVRE